MIDAPAPVTRTPPAPPAPTAPGGAAGGFVQLLSAFLDGNAGDAAETSAAGTAAGRQGVAEDGKPLPKGSDDDDDGDHPALTWLPVPLPPPAPLAVTRPLPRPGGLGRTAGELPGATIEPNLLPGIAPAGVQTGTVATPADGAQQPVTPPADLLAARTDALAAAAAAAAQRSAARAASIIPLAPPASSPITASVPSSAGQIFAAAMSAASGPARTGQERDQPDSTGALSPSAAAQIDTANQPVIQAVADAKHGALDLRDDRGLQGIIDRIEVLRDDADSRDTRIRLKPDALGSVDVAVRKDGDTIHVHFTAETQATRTLLTDAQPRLAELAEARGVKLGQSSVDAGGGDASRQPRPDAPQPRAPLAAAMTDTATDILSTDQRLA